MLLPRWGPLAVRHDGFVEEMRGALGDEEFERSHAVGRATQLERWLVGV